MSLHTHTILDCQEFSRSVLVWEIVFLLVYWKY